MTEPVLDTIAVFAKVYIDFRLPGSRVDEQKGWYTMPLDDLCKVENVPSGHVQIVIGSTHDGKADVTCPLERYQYILAADLMNQLGQLDCFPLRRVRFANVSSWDYRFNSLLCLLQNRTYDLEFDGVNGSQYIPTLHALVLINGPCYLRNISLKGYDTPIPVADVTVFLDAVSRIQDLSRLHLDFRPDGGCCNPSTMMSELCARVAQMRRLVDLQLCGETFEFLSSGSLIGDVLYNGINEAKVKSITVKPYGEHARDRTYQLSFSSLQECVCSETSTALEEIHLSRVLLTQNHRRSKTACNNVRVLDLKTAFNRACERVTEDLLGLFPKLVYCRLDNCSIQSFGSVGEYIGRNKLLREVQMVGNKLDNRAFEIVKAGVKDWGHLRVLNLKQNKVVLTNKMRDGWSVQLRQTNLENFVWEHCEWYWEWNGDWKRLTAALCVHQMYNFLEDRKEENGGNVPDYMWPGIFVRASKMGEWEESNRQSLDNRMEYKGDHNSNFYKASIKESKASDVLSVVHWLLTQPYAKAMGSGGCIAMNNKNGDKKRKREAKRCL